MTHNQALSDVYFMCYLMCPGRWENHKSSNLGHSRPGEIPGHNLRVSTTFLSAFLLLNRALDPHSFFADPEPFFYADPDPGRIMIRIHSPGGIFLLNLFFPFIPRITRAEVWVWLLTRLLITGYRIVYYRHSCILSICHDSAEVKTKNTQDFPVFEMWLFSCYRFSLCSQEKIPVRTYLAHLINLNGPDLWKI